MTISADSILAVRNKAIQQLTMAYAGIWAVGILGIIFGYRLFKKEESRRTAVIAELEASIGKVKMLSGLLPICSVCKKIRDDQGYWSQIEVYIRDHSEAQFSHGICMECAKKHYPELDLD